MSRDRLSALRAQQESTNAMSRDPYSTTASWLYPPGLTRVQPPAPVSIPQVPPIAYVQSNMQSGYAHVMGSWNYPWSYPTSAVPSKGLYLEKRLSDPSEDRPLIQKNLPSKPINIVLEDDMTRFYAEIASIQDKLRIYNDNVSRISESHSHALDSMDWATARRSTGQVESLMAETCQLGNDLRLRIKNIHAARKGEKSREMQIRKQQAALVKHKFIQAIQNYQQVEQLYRHRYKQRLEKQLKIVNPEATPEEVQTAVDSNQDNQVFARMVQSCNRLGESRVVFREIQERHDDIQKIERTLYELAQLFNDMDTLVMTQGEAIDEIEVFATDVEKHAEVGYMQMGKAIDSARALRKSKWFCVALAVLCPILLIISIIVFSIAAANGNL